MENRRVSMNRHTNLLQLEEHMYPLVDVATPNVFRNLFPYSEVPKIAFNDRVVPHHMPDDIWITDTTFRDGQQSRGRTKSSGPARPVLRPIADQTQ